MAFNLDDYRAVHMPWTFTVRGTTYTARPVSTEQVLAYQAACDDPKTGPTALRRLMRHAFPYRVSMGWRGDPVDVICAARPFEQRAILTDFFGSLAGPNPQPEHQTRGTP